MKKSFVPTLVVLALAYMLVVQVAVHASVSALNLPALVGILCGSSLLFLVFSDYSRKPRFRARGIPRASAVATTPTTSQEVEAASAWTYTTLSA